MVRALQELFRNLRKFSLDFIAITDAVIITYTIFSDAWSGAYIIENIPAPESLRNEDIAARLRDEIGKLALSAHNAIRPVTQDQAQQPDVKIAGTDISLRYFTTVLRSFIGSGG